MPKNRLGLKALPLRRLKVGQAVILGPYNSANMAAGKVVQMRQKDPSTSNREFVQQQFIMVDPRTLVAYKVYLVRRIK
jgi:hypothetical protein